jgi:hypothetical protein
MPSTEPVGSDPAPRPTRRTITSEYKLRVVAEYDAAPRNEKGAVLRRERLFHSHVKEWRAARDAGALESLVDHRTAPAPDPGTHPLTGCPAGPVPPDNAAPNGYLRLTDASNDFDP